MHTKIGEFKGNTVLEIYYDDTDKYPLILGASKLKKILLAVEEDNIVNSMKEFVKTYSKKKDNNPE